MIFRDVDYNFPEAAFFILAALIWFLLFYLLKIHRDTVLQKFFSHKLLRTILLPRSKTMTWLKHGALILSWIFGCIALMEPLAHSRYIHTENKIQMPADRNPPRTLLFVIDASETMRVKDTRLGITRLDDAKAISQAILEQIGSVNTGVFAYTSILTQLSPPTPDQLFARLMIKSIKVNEGDVAGTNLLKALENLKKDVLSNPTDTLYSVILITDGGDNDLETLQGAAKDERRKAILDVLKSTPGVNLRVFTIGTGSLEGANIPDYSYQGHPVHSALDEALLKDIAQAGHGKYYRANAYTPFTLAQDLSREILVTAYNPPSVVAPETEESIESGIVYDLYFQIPLSLSLLFLALGIFWPETSHKRERPHD